MDHCEIFSLLSAILSLTISPKRLPKLRRWVVKATMGYKTRSMPTINQVYEQMSLAVDRDATRLWVLNVGDLKPYERETEFFLTYGWNATRWNPDNLDAFVFAWAQREFDLDPHQADAVVDIVGNLTRFNARRKPELWDSTTYSLTSYREYVSLFLPLLI